MPGFNAIIGQTTALRALQRLVRLGTTPHALLFTGIAGVGKRTTARLLAMALNCRIDSAAGNAGPCGNCLSCRRIDGGVHPDIIHIEPRDGLLRIDQIRQLLTTLALKPFNASHRVVIIAEAHSLNAEAGNALLKVLEEPPADTFLILTAIQRSDLLPTIVSRCRHIRFHPLTADVLARMLIADHGVDAHRAAAIAEAAGGSFTRAISLAEAHWNDQRDWVVGAIGLDGTTSRGINGTALALAYAAELAQNKTQIDVRLEILKSWIRDLCIWPYEPRHIINKDRQDALRTVRNRLDNRRLLEIWEAVEKAHKAIASNGNLRLTLDVMALRMARLMAA